LAISREIARLYQHFTIEGEAGFGGRVGDHDGVEGWSAVYVRYDGFPWNHVIRTTVGFSTGVDYLSNPEVDQYFLHYFAPEIAFALPKYPDKELVFRYHHRSGLFGTFGDELQGSTVMSLGLRFRF
jgi:hypothetical protein